MQAVISLLILAVAMLMGILTTWLVLRLRASKHRREDRRAGRFSGPWRWRG
jgi:uncharacterized integral membrane protein